MYAFLKVPEQFLAIEGDYLNSNITPMQMLPHKQKRWVHSCICRGKGRLPHLTEVGSHLQHFVPSILLVNKVQKVKHTEVWKDGKSPDLVHNLQPEGHISFPSRQRLCANAATNVKVLKS